MFTSFCQFFYYIKNTSNSSFLKHNIHKTGVINDPLGQPSVPADSDCRLILKFCDGRPDRLTVTLCENSEALPAGTVVGLVDQYSKDIFLSNDVQFANDGKFWTFRLPRTRVPSLLHWITWYFTLIGWRVLVQNPLPVFSYDSRFNISWVSQVDLLTHQAPVK